MTVISALRKLSFCALVSISALSCAESADPENMDLKTAVPQDSESTFSWPGGARAAVSLGYDDALDSQLDIAIPALDKYGFKGSFYVPVNRPVLVNRLSEWRAAAENGHELGNHSIFHQCDASLPDRDWVPPNHDLSKVNAQVMAEQVAVANNMLFAIDGKTERTYTAPCGDLEADGVNYIELIEKSFVGIKTSGTGVTPDMGALDPSYVSTTSPAGVTGEALIAIVEAAAARGTMANITFHGIGGDYLTVSKEAHEELLAHLAKHPDKYWVDSFLNIMKHVRAQQNPK